ncbi:probable cytochrome P450 6a13 [Athalia rosae]|uniref:probable cytochrome P450 6a13 n=1 Tax=Athalia rosae TaxID=37344 RepID=UPI0020347D90|nr:probable cytochrome P450 6a13 [Athalia rosae]
MVGDLGLVEVLCALGLVCIWIWYYLGATYGFWKNLGVPGPEPLKLYGNFKDITLGRAAFGPALKEMCDPYPEAAMVGIYARRTPILLLRDPELIKDVLIKDFSTFSERGTPVNEKLEPLSVHLFNLESKRWRFLRPKLSPAFTSGKMRHMFSLILECANYFEEYLNRLADKGEPIDCREITAKFTTDVIGSCAFGLQMNSLADEDSEFRKMGRKVFQFDRRSRILMTIRNAAPWLYQLLGKPVLPKEVTEFFVSTVKQTMDYRRENNVKRGDLIDMLMEIKDSPEKSDCELTDNLITAQAFVFFVAGFETSSTTISHALYELSQRQDLQDKLRKEINESLKSNNGNISYESIKDMKYLHMVFQETLRLRPPVYFHMRKAIEKYTFRDNGITIPKGQRVWIPVWEIHQNPEHYPNPEVFDPERFSAENIAARHPMTYLPFGDGPRNCIGARFAVYQTKLGLIKILANFKVDVCEKTQIPYVPSPKGILLDTTEGIHLKFIKLDQSQS